MIKPETTPAPTGTPKPRSKKSATLDPETVGAKNPVSAKDPAKPRRARTRRYQGRRPAPDTGVDTQRDIGAGNRTQTRATLDLRYVF